MPTLTQPAIGSTSWGTQMNTNLQLLQTQLTNAMQGRIALTSTTKITLQQYTGDTVEVNGLNVSMGSSGIALNTTDNLITSSGADSGGAMAASTLYYVYLSNANASSFASQLRASSTVPTSPSAGLNGVRYLGASGNAANWRFIGYVRTNASTQFEDNTTNRLVINYYNRRPLNLFANPGYVNDNADTTYTASGNWAKANGGTNSGVSFISNGEDTTMVQAVAVGNTDATNNVFCGPGIDGAAPTKAGRMYSSTVTTMTVDDSQILSEGFHTADLYLASYSGAEVFYADFSRRGASADPRVSRIIAVVNG